VKETIVIALIPLGMLVVVLAWIAVLASKRNNFELNVRGLGISVSIKGGRKT